MLAKRVFQLETEQFRMFMELLRQLRLEARFMAMDAGSQTRLWSSVKLSMWIKKSTMDTLMRLQF